AITIMCIFIFFFFFQAEDGIRDKLVTGVQTCALPISPIKGLTFMSQSLVKNLVHLVYSTKHREPLIPVDHRAALFAYQAGIFKRSEERRVGKECRSRGWP